MSYCVSGVAVSRCCRSAQPNAIVTNALKVMIAALFMMHENLHAMCQRDLQRSVRGRGGRLWAIAIAPTSRPQRRGGTLRRDDVPEVGRAQLRLHEANEIADRADLAQALVREHRVELLLDVRERLDELDRVD